jgi:phosphate transport system substrate-binding protein
MTYVKLVNSDGKAVSPELKTFQAASANADFTKVDGFYLILTNQPGADSWPITGATWVLLRMDGDKDQNKAVTKFFTWCLTKGQDQAQKLQYVPLTSKTYDLIKAYWKKNLGI